MSLYYLSQLDTSLKTALVLMLYHSDYSSASSYKEPAKYSITSLLS